MSRGAEGFSGVLRRRFLDLEWLRVCDARSESTWRVSSMRSCNPVVLSGAAGEMFRCITLVGDFADFVCEVGGRIQTALSLAGVYRLLLWR
jgi:hypothetical protein